MNYFSRYKTNNRASLNIFQACEFAIGKTQDKLQMAINSFTTSNILERVQACSEAAVNLALIVDAIDQGALDGNPSDLNTLKRSCGLFVEMIYRANIQEDQALFERIIHELQAFKETWGHFHQNHMHTFEGSAPSTSAVGL